VANLFVGDIEWDEFLIAMAEDTSMINSDNEDAEHPLTNVNSTYSLSGLANKYIAGAGSNASAGMEPAPDKPIRRRNSSNNLSHSGNHGAVDAQHLQYLDILSVNNVATTAEVHVPQVKEASLFKTLSVISVLEDPSKLAAMAAERSGPVVGANVGNCVAAGARGKPPLPPKHPAAGITKGVASGAAERSVAEIAEQIRIAKRAAGYDSALCILPARLRAINEVYVDYDADSDDERFTAALQVKLHKPANAKAQNPRASSPSNSNNSSSTAPELKVRCVELMMARLEREFELARLFCSKSTGQIMILSAIMCPLTCSDACFVACICSWRALKHRYQTFERKGRKGRYRDALRAQ
jgi:hypothetical protein